MQDDVQENSTTFTTKGGLPAMLSKSAIQSDSALDRVYQLIDAHKGVVLSSGFDYPGRHSRWDLGFVDPALEFISKARSFSVNALNPQGALLLPVIENALSKLDHVESLRALPASLEGIVKPAAKHIKEEERSKQPSVFSVLRALNNLFGFDGASSGHFGLYGAFGYDLIHQFEDIRLNHSRSDDLKDCHLYLPLSLIVVDRKKEQAFIEELGFETPGGRTWDAEAGGASFTLPQPFGRKEIESDHQPGEFADKVHRVVEGTQRGDYFEVVLSQTFSTGFDGTPTTLFKRLAEVNPSPYMFLINFGNEQLVGASPEMFVRITGRTYETCPIAGTIQRGTSALEDADRVLELISSNKDESELTMCTDVDRNDMARVCKPGSVKVIGRRQLEFYSHLIHTVDHLQGQLADEFDSIDAFQSHMWACTVTGAPKPAAVQEIENLESSVRGWYSGAVGLFALNGDINTGIMLRTAHLKDGRASIRAGATLLYGSDPKLEEQETRTKAAAFLAALADSRKASPQVVDERADFTSSLRQKTPKRKVLLVDYRDSFVHNLASYLRELGSEVVTLRAGFPVHLLDQVNPDLVLLSPGPGTPSSFGISATMDELMARNLPVFGVCLGHQGIGEYFGANLGILPTPVHGKCSVVRHNGDGIFADIPEEFEVGRYHSLFLEEQSIPDKLEVLAISTNQGSVQDPFPVVMSIRHKSKPVAGVQFHPESLMTLKQHIGHQLLHNVLKELV